MKFLKTLFLLFLLALVFSAVVYALTSGTITATWADIIGEVAVVAVPIFVFFIFIYLIAKAVGKTVKKGNKKAFLVRKAKAVLSSFYFVVLQVFYNTGKARKFFLNIF